MSSYQVIIVGGGPVGVGLAVELGLRGITSIVVERHAKPQLPIIPSRKWRPVKPRSRFTRIFNVCTARACF